MTSLTNSTDDLMDIIPTKAMLLKKSPIKDNYKATVFQPPIKYSSLNKSNDKNVDNLKNKPEQSSTNNEFDLKKAKHEVLNFGISGLETKDKQAAKLAVAIRLGAKPPKNPYKNYKELIAEKKLAKEEQQKEMSFLQLGKNAQGNASVTYKKLVNARRKKALNGQIDRHYGVVRPNMKKKKK